ncbi:membrane protein insertase YidC [Gilvimarinus agarilyticus]|uniref:membrane protein insertase YidC n=1 Tax=unclassified Gilvimarinus TaxID=2642066 RepID=UPI001C084BEC|nr:MULTISPECIES: membrane protein insertase YidC [unclassified Gilvimarinus]MBU2884211.1 membrane protein insertase YidC [Gilvimarinus agarilyticus]MDO6569350.1 membrane protein insertase YidC [Gilvimarinus sp. 2_MG-2023]MDO6747504.1 membrane protein insertase YidC [Gilvimarinus sp. 1_MG-2023]
MDWQKNLLIAAMVAVIVLLVIRWEEFQERQAETTAEIAEEQVNSPKDSDIPAVVSGDVPVTEIPGQASPEITSTQVIRVTTDTLKVAINPTGGDITEVSLPKHYAEIDTPDQPFVLVNNRGSKTYTAQSGLIGPNGTDSSDGRPVFTASDTQYQMSEGQDTLQVDLTTKQDSVTVTKRFTFYRGEYRVEVSYLIENGSSENWQAALYGQIKRDSHEPDTANGFGMQPFVGAALTTNDERYKKFSFDDLEEKSFKASVQGGWVSMVQHYFISAWIPAAESQNQYYLRQQGSQDIYLMGFTSPMTTVAPGESQAIAVQYYAGPKDTEALEAIAPYLDLTVDYGWLWWMAKPLFGVLKYIHEIIGNWGLSIIALTIIIKAIFFKLSATSYRSMARMRKLAPKMKELKERHGDDRQKMSQETMKLYRDEKVNPLGGCLPMLIQMPVFLALYWVLMESVELRHTPFLWIPDLSIKDPIFVLPLLMGFTMWLTMRLNPEPPDPTQAKIMKLMPVVFTFMFLWFPAGLVLYWVTNNTLSFLQQMVITRQIEKSDNAST